MQKYDEGRRIYFGNNRSNQWQMGCFRTWVFPDEYFNLIPVSQRPMGRQIYRLTQRDIWFISSKPVRNVTEQNKIHVKSCQIYKWIAHTQKLLGDNDKRPMKSSQTLGPQESVSSPKTGGSLVGIHDYHILLTGPYHMPSVIKMIPWIFALQS